MLRNDTCYNGNWELSMIEGVMGIRVFTENRTLFDHSVVRRSLSLFLLRQ
jgi:hypothetical protein